MDGNSGVDYFRVFDDDPTKEPSAKACHARVATRTSRLDVLIVYSSRIGGQCFA